ncbi:MAG: hypothetical protein RL104_527, partial [Bacteroidota bacterium]
MKPSAPASLIAASIKTKAKAEANVA